MGRGKLGGRCRTTARAVALVCASLTIFAAAAGASKPASNVYGWGWNFEGILGNGKFGKSSTMTSTPSALHGLGDVRQIVNSGSTGLALLDNGDVMAWGSSWLGNGGTEGSPTPVPVAGLSDVTSVAATVDTQLALREDGTVLAWGQNGFGTVGDGTTTRKYAPVEVKGLGRTVAIATGGKNSLAVLSDGTVWEWGDSFPRGSQSGRIDTVPVQVPGIADAIAVAAGNNTAVALLASGELLAWGFGAKGELGDGERMLPEGSESFTAPAEPQHVCAVGTSGPCPHGPYLTGVASVVASDDFVVAALEDGTAAAWGTSDDGQLGDGTSEGPEVCESPRQSCSATPVAVSGLSGVSALAVGLEHTLALLSDGQVEAWGANQRRQLGDGNASFSTVPTPVLGLSDIVGVGAGGRDSYAFGSQRPAVAHSAPTKGVGGTEVKIKGLNLLTATAVDFGSTPASAFTVTSASTITATAPTLARGTYVVKVTSAGGTSLPTEHDSFTVR